MYRFPICVTRSNALLKSSFGGLLSLLLIGTLPTLNADELHLRSGVKLPGQLVSESEVDGKTVYVFQTEQGIEMTVDSGSVIRVRVDSAEVQEFLNARESIDDTIEDHLRMADLADELRLPRQYKDYHLWAVIRHDFDHADARKRLLYTMQDGVWGTPEQRMNDLGYVRSGRTWILPAEIELLEIQEQRQQIVNEWKRSLTAWQGWLGGSKQDEALRHIREVRDPAAISTIAELLMETDNRAEKQLWVDTLERIGNPAITSVLRQLALFDEDDDIRDRCLRIIAPFDLEADRRFFLSHLNPAENHPIVINRAGRALEVVGNESVVRSMIEALVTEHKRTEGGSNGGGGGGGQNLNFSAGGPNGGLGGLTMNEQPRVITEYSRNAGVLGGLSSLTGLNYGYDKQAWLQWYVEQNSYPDVDLRRGIDLP